MSEHVENLGRRAALRQQRLRMVAECEALRDRLRRALPLEEEIGELDRDVILQTALAFNQSAEELAAVDKKLAVLNRVLGE